MALGGWGVLDQDIERRVRAVYKAVEKERTSPRSLRMGIYPPSADAVLLSNYTNADTGAAARVLYAQDLARLRQLLIAKAKAHIRDKLALIGQLANRLEQTYAEDGHPIDDLAARLQKALALAPAADAALAAEARAKAASAAHPAGAYTTVFVAPSLTSASDPESPAHTFAAYIRESAAEHPLFPALWRILRSDKHDEERAVLKSGTADEKRKAARVIVNEGLRDHLRAPVTTGVAELKHALDNEDWTVFRGLLVALVNQEYAPDDVMNKVCGDVVDALTADMLADVAAAAAAVIAAVVVLSLLGPEIAISAAAVATIGVALDLGALAVDGVQLVNLLQEIAAAEVINRADIVDRTYHLADDFEDRSLELALLLVSVVGGAAALKGLKTADRSAELFAQKPAPPPRAPAAGAAVADVTPGGGASGPGASTKIKIVPSAEAEAGLAGRAVHAPETHPQATGTAAPKRGTLDAQRGTGAGAVTPEGRAVTAEGRGITAEGQGITAEARGHTGPPAANAADDQALLQLRAKQSDIFAKLNELEKKVELLETRRDALEKERRKLEQQARKAARGGKRAVQAAPGVPERLTELRHQIDDLNREIDARRAAMEPIYDQQTALQEKIQGLTKFPGIKTPGVVHEVLAINGPGEYAFELVQANTAALDGVSLRLYEPVWLQVKLITYDPVVNMAAEVGRALEKLAKYNPAEVAEALAKLGAKVDAPPTLVGARIEIRLQVVAKMTPAEIAMAEAAAMAKLGKDYPNVQLRFSYIQPASPAESARVLADIAASRRALTGKPSPPTPATR
jgi:hypothetical protein